MAARVEGGQAVDEAVRELMRGGETHFSPLSGGL